MATSPERGGIDALSRKRLVDATTTVIVLTATMAVVLVWATGVADARLAWAVLAIVSFGGVYQLLATRLEARPSARRLGGGAAALHLSMLPLLSVVWLLLGVGAHPFFILAFALPVATSALVPYRPYPFIVALVSTAFVGLTIMVGIPEVAWYVGLRSEGVGRLFQALGSPFDRGNASVLFMRPAELPVLLVWVGSCFAALAFGVAALGAVLPGLGARLRASQIDVRRARNYGRQLLDAAPDPAALVDPETGMIVRANAALRRFSPAARPQTSLADALGLRDAEQLMAIMEGGELPLVCCQIDGSTRICHIRASPVEGRRSRVAVVVEDETDRHVERVVLDAVGGATIVMANDGRIAFASDAACDLFADLRVGARAKDVLPLGDSEAAWWDPRPRRRARRPVVIGGREFAAELTTSAYPGRADRLVTVVLVPESGA